MISLRQGDIAYFDLNPVKGNEMRKKRPCLIVSNDNYNQIMNTVIVAPISSSKKYTREQKYIESPFFIDISDQEIKGTALLQHIRAVDPKVRAEEPKTHLSADKINLVGQVLKEFF